jgi:PIN domain nuclease of toxin-antitoxin system
VRTLLDTHVFIWWLFDSPKLSQVAYAHIADPANQIFVSAASVCEIAIKLAINKLPLPSDLDDDELFASLAGTGFSALPVTLKHAYAVRHLPWHHRDPFDRLLVAQSRIEGMTLVTNDAALRRYDLQTLW